MTEITITPIGEPAEHKSKFGFLYTYEECKHLAQFDYDGKLVKNTCENCGNLQQDDLNVVAKYGEFDCQRCGAKNSVGAIVPEATHIVWNRQVRLVFWMH